MVISLIELTSEDSFAIRYKRTRWSWAASKSDGRGKQLSIKQIEQIAAVQLAWAKLC
jgi:hypothetical protein